ncbi:uroporphyrinogen decarboxylase family protein [Blautia liquoris]|uniref:Uroporphyrinogen decarboxylase family protein n=1 Tax=Blautia liquoris TaxID=2779518 RepID=A0A7M2RGZ8_9FIRM|nr:uroporphyrinogen decarboxylase family protein [Blautia liquoris]QOV18642.1 uroporphyrinogen decarboxylase family protein [Blautia liquoris]
MNSYERVMNRLAGKPVDYLPNLSLTMMFAAKEAGVSFGEFCSDYRKLSEGALRCHEKYGIDMVCVISDPMRETEGFGTEVVIPSENVPYPKVRRIKNIEDIDTLKVIEPFQCRRMNDRVEAVRFLKERVQNDIPVIGWIEGAFAESCDLMGMQEFFMNLMEEPDAMNQLMDICMEQGLRFARAQIEAGAEIIGIGDAASSLIGPSLYEEFALPYQQKLISAVHAMGAKVKLHICGNLNPVLHYVAQTGADIVDLDSMVDMEAAADILPEKSSICGNFNPVQVLYNGTPQLVRSEVERCMGIADKNRSMISPGCEIPRDSASENVLAIHQAIAERGFL